MGRRRNTTSPVQPDLAWCSSISNAKGILSRCPLAAVSRCPRYYQSLYLLGQAEHSTSIPKEQNEELLRHWQGREGWPVTDEQMSSVSGSDGRLSYHNFCPEAAYNAFGYFASHLLSYADEADMDAAHHALEAIESEIGKDWRWGWFHVEPLHYSDCSLYSLLSKSAEVKPDCAMVPVVERTEAVEPCPESIQQALFQRVWRCHPWVKWPVIGILVVAIVLGGLWAMLPDTTKQRVLHCLFGW